ncbi:Aste57867_21812 [Aphanomyces stellatus]|uniref:Aste57867_21812 protein n=1 Tax=Aphanomyces stellatus TaxID=120398 RepID=A0A485LIH4_9STRA|nr:hypothetical protein As57867_021743 [Aphanomyces stellatus]VFT98481.1 Aste57867_21812 [Aphanomyces stellatus]
MMKGTTQTPITLKGSAEIVMEFFGFSINNILYQRGIYPPESFTRVSKYGLAMVVTADEKLRAFLKNVLDQLAGWLVEGQVQKLVLVVENAATEVILERWVFDIYAEPETPAGARESTKPVSEIMREIQAIMRQITASVSFLPLLTEQCTFDLLVYTDKDVHVPQTWEESDPRMVENSVQVRLRSFSTNVHKVDAMVAYKDPDTTL